ncbi:histidine kinase [Aquimarina gracilis]|uniref:Histidine kinase n=1 Tax=Aquimarina gracilis TaxID=874422 RepID=A0ABU5ZRK4_9FLAO|nr:histidine kinase [Aquimarina gracilis]MEB3344711.1 histidine kinase [Aquimarina gracilis]
MKLTQQSWFWILQFLGWGGLALTQVFLKSAIIEDVSLNYIITEGILIVVSGVLFTSLMRWFYLRKISFDDFNLQTVLWVVVTILVTCFLLVGFEYMIASYFYSIFEGKEIEFNFLANILNTFFMLLFWGILYFSIKAFLRSQKEKVERLKLISNLKESQLNTLKGQINPHFMFNSLNNIRGLMLEDVPKSREMITKLSELLRYSLNSDTLDTILLQEELETVENYVELSKIQLEDRLEYREKVDKNVLDVEVPPMLIQMLIENAIKHGVSNQVKGGWVELEIHKEEYNLCIIVSNNGRLKQVKSSTRIGLNNIKERLRLLYGNKALFDLKEENDKVIAKIRIPLDES